MSDITLILLCAGESSRFNNDVKKHWLRVDHAPLWSFVSSRFAKTSHFDKILIVANPDEIEFMREFSDYELICGGSTRQESLKNAIQRVETSHILVSDVARACVDEELIQRMVDAKNSADVTVPYINVADTAAYNGNTINRDDLKLIQTPQMSKTSSIRDAFKSNISFTDESSAIVANGGSRNFVTGDENAHKLTFAKDLQKLSCLDAPSRDVLVGNGFDVHGFEDGKKMSLCGVQIDSTFGFKAHSDGDVAIHALIDALLGAAGLGDIGMLFPDSDKKYENIDSKELLKITVSYLNRFGLEVVNVDVTIMAETPRLAPYKSLMRSTISSILGIDKFRVNIKATTTEKLGFIGRKEGVGVMATASLKYYDWTTL
ncbi:MAG: bifunctional 2-C-methyl-D-erythritol 4-phosphate cytidylyltransferase/2-C-methyl-D-erythritol 2,4-cyclodiphosphate synthase [Campylobacterota bacterium]|nr:bifunctional 2-C-methyl-D-erythritol 4-phosphate cytidylyltransferase/2-C-methyl-D-erythritol 2,4-cyclodiphosphate synthase [Campylobacterota bacterium]